MQDTLVARQSPGIDPLVHAILFIFDFKVTRRYFFIGCSVHWLQYYYMIYEKDMLDIYTASVICSFALDLRANLLQANSWTYSKNNILSPYRIIR